jgi:hypothetical protein
MRPALRAGAHVFPSRCALGCGAKGWDTWVVRWDAEACTERTGPVTTGLGHAAGGAAARPRPRPGLSSGRLPGNRPELPEESGSGDAEGRDLATWVCLGGRKPEPAPGGVPSLGAGRAAGAGGRPRPGAAL